MQESLVVRSALIVLGKPLESSGMLSLSSTVKYADMQSARRSSTSVLERLSMLPKDDQNHHNENVSG